MSNAHEADLARRRELKASRVRKLRAMPADWDRERRAAELGISENYCARLCREYDIETPKPSAERTGCYDTGLVNRFLGRHLKTA